MKTMLFNPYSGKPRHPADIASDPQGLLMPDPDEPMLACVPPKCQPLTDAELRMIVIDSRDLFEGSAPMIALGIMIDRKVEAAINGGEA